MNNPLDAGHEQLITAACSGLRSAWRGAAERSGQRARAARAEPIDAHAPARIGRARSLLGVVVAAVLVVAHTLPLNFHLRHASRPGNGVDGKSAPDISGD